MTKTRSDDWEDYQHTVMARLDTTNAERKAWLEDHGIDDFKQMIFSKEKYYYVFRNSEDALRFKVVWG